VQKTNITYFSILPLFIIVLLNEISYQMVIPTMNHVVNLTLSNSTQALANTMYGGGIAAFTIAVILGSPLIGFLSDRFGRKSLLTGCLLLMILSSLLFIASFYFQNIIYFLVARFISGIAGASTAIVQAAIADTSFDRARSVHFSVVGIALTIGLIIGPLLGGFFIKGQEISPVILSMPFYITAIISLLNIFLFLFLFKETAHPRSDYENLVVRFSFGKTGKFLLIFFLLEFSWSLYFLTLPTFLGQIFSYDSQHISFFLSTTGIAMCFGLAAYRWISKYLNNIAITKLFFRVFIFSLILIIFIKNIILNWLIIIPITLSVALTYVAIMGLLSESIVQENQGALMGTTLTTMALAWTLTAFGTKFLFNIDPYLPFLVSIMGLGVGVALVYKK
jgi:DHA1 family tetracycline resistance protein-like MFS transporter